MRIRCRCQGSDTQECENYADGEDSMCTRCRNNPHCVEMNELAARGEKPSSLFIPWSDLEEI